MVRKLRFLFQNQTASRLFLKTTVASLALLEAFVFGFRFLPVFAALLLLGAIYLKEPSEKKSVWVLFWSLTLLSLTGLYSVGSSGAGALAVFVFFLVFASAFFILLGIINFFIPKRFAVYGFLNTVVLLGLFLQIFYNQAFLFNSSPPLFLKIFLVFLLVLLFRECFYFFGAFPRGKVRLASLVLGLITLELMGLLAFLPLGFVNAAAFLALFLLLARDTFLAHFQGFLNLRFVFKEIAIFVFVGLVIFSTAVWTV